MKIAIASYGSPFSVSTWSGIPAHIAIALRHSQHEVFGIALNKPREPWYYDWYRRLYYRVQQRWFLAEVEPSLLKQMARQLDDEVEAIQPDVVIVIHGDFLAYTSFKQPAVIIHDATFASLLGYYPAFSNLTKRSIRAGNTMYQLALDRADAAVFSAEWASSSAKKDYYATASKVFTIPLGANLNAVPESESVEEWIEKRIDKKICNFLFLGVDWIRKGGPDALSFVTDLNRRGIASRLLVAGCVPTIHPEQKKYVELLGFLRKDVKAEADRLEQLLIHSHALLLPSLAECYGCVYCEANAYGLPAIGRDTGGVPQIIKDGLNGMLWTEGETPEIFAARWEKLWLNRQNYLQMSYAAREEYATRLNYDVFVRKLEVVLMDIIHKEAVALDDHGYNRPSLKG